MPRIAKDGDEYLGLLNRYGGTAIAFHALEPGFRYFHTDQGCCIAFVENRGAWVAAGAPVGPQPEAALAEFVAAAEAYGRSVCFCGNDGTFATRYTQLRHTQVGELPWWRPAEWQTTLKRSASLREQTRRARAKGTTVSRLDGTCELPDGLGPAIEAVTHEWFASRRSPPLSFMATFDLNTNCQQRVLFVALRGGTAVALLNVVPTFGERGWFFKDLLRGTTAPNGATELLIDHAMGWAAQTGAERVTTGMTPLAGDVSPWLAAVGHLVQPLYNTAGLKRFRNRLRPQWAEPIYISYPPAHGAATALWHSLSAFVGGRPLTYARQSLSHALARRLSRGVG